ncbi:MAG: ATP-dependent DNA ligase [Euryarchaeota archaeon]|nr:ATP-dependent DNA ligase [Euryarchaeota archaeon]
MKTIRRKEVLKTLLKLYGELGRPVHLADLKRELRILTKRDTTRRTHTESDALARALQRLFDEGKISKSRELVRVERYPVSPYAKTMKQTTANVRFYAPIECAGKRISFELNGESYELDFIDCRMEGEPKTPTKKEMVLEVLKACDRALTVREILERINEKHGAYDVSTKQKFYNATTSLTKGVLKKLMRNGLRARKIDGRWVWYFTEEQLENYRKHYVDSDVILRAVEDLVKSEKCVPLTKVVSTIGLSSEDVKYKIKRAGKLVPVTVKVATTLKDTKVELEVGEYRRDSFIDWLGVVVPRSENGYGYETMLIDLTSDWEDALKRQIRKSLSRIHIRKLIGIFYEKLVAKLFQLLCTSEELTRDPELSRYMIPFVFRSERVANVWVTMPGGRRGEFDVLIKGTFRAFDVMAEGRGFLDLVIPIESKYTVVTTEHVTYFDDKVRKVFGDARNVLPIMVGLSWKPDAMALAKRFGFMTLYFSSIQNLLRALTGTEYSLEGEWKRVEEMLNKGEITLEELRRRINDLEIKYEFEELLERRIGRSLSAKVSRKTPSPYAVSKQKEEGSMPALKPMLAVAARSIEEILSQHPMLAWEYKLDGIRVLVKKEAGRVRLYSRNGKDLTEKFPGVAEEVARGFDGDEWIIDGELVAKNDDGRWLPPQKLRREGNGNWKYIVFDVLRLNGEDLTDYSYEERRQILENKTLENSKIQIVPRIVSSSKVEVEEFFTQAKTKGHEGLVAKALASPYKPGRRHRYWFKFKGEPDTLDLVVVGYNYGKGGGIKSLLLAARRDGKFFTVGKVGSGISRRDRKMLKEMLDECAVKVRPANVVSAEFQDLWVEPKIVVEVSHEGIMESGKHSSGCSLRFPRFVRVRDDKDVDEVSLITKT